MVVADYFHIPNWLSLIIILVILAVTIAASLFATRKQGLAADVAK